MHFFQSLVPTYPDGPSSTQVPHRNLLEYGVARMVKLVDTRDLKSLGHCGCAGSIPAPGTNTPSKNIQKRP